MTDENPIGNRIASYRRYAGYEKASDLADAIPNPKVTTSVIQNIESGRKADLSVTQLLEISYALGVSPLFLLAPMSQRMDRVELPNVSASIASMTVDEFDRWIALLPGAPMPTLDRVWAWSASTAARLLRDLTEAVHEWDELGDRPTGDDAVQIRGVDGEVMFDGVEHYDHMLGRILPSLAAMFNRLEKFPTVNLDWVPDDLVSEIRAYEAELVAEQEHQATEARRERNLEDAGALPLEEMDDWLAKRVPRAESNGDG